MKQTSKRSVPQTNNVDRNNSSKIASIQATQKQRKSLQNQSANIQKSACYDSLIEEANPSSLQAQNINSGFCQQQISFVSQNSPFISYQQSFVSQTKQSLAQQKLNQLLDSTTTGGGNALKDNKSSFQTQQGPLPVHSIIEKHNLTDLSPSRKTKMPIETRTRITTHLLTEGNTPVTTAQTAVSMLDNSAYSSFKQQKTTVSRVHKPASKASQYPHKFNDHSINYQSILKEGEREKINIPGYLNQSTTNDGSKLFASSNSGSKPKTPQVTQQTSQRATISPGSRQKPSSIQNSNYSQFSNYHPLNSFLPQERHFSSGSAAHVFIQQVKDKIQQTRHKSKQPSFSINSQNVSQILNNQDSFTQEQPQSILFNPQSVKSTNNNGFIHEKNSKSMLVGRTCLEQHLIPSLSPNSNDPSNLGNLSHNISIGNNNHNISFSLNNTPNVIQNKSHISSNNYNQNLNVNNIINNNAYINNLNQVKLTPPYHSGASQFTQSPSIHSLLKKPKIQLDFLHPASAQTRAQTQASSRRDGVIDSQKSSIGHMNKSILGLSQKSHNPIYLVEDSAGTSNRQYNLNHDYHSKSSPKLPITKGHESVRIYEDALEDFQQKNKFSLEKSEQYFENFFSALSELQRMAQLSGKQQVSVSHNTTSTFLQSSSACSSSSERLLDSLKQIITTPIRTLIQEYNSLKQQNEVKKQQEKREKEVLEMKVGMLQQERDKLLHLTGSLSKQQIKNQQLLQEKLPQKISGVSKKMTHPEDIKYQSKNSASESQNTSSRDATPNNCNSKSLKYMQDEINKLKEIQKKQRNIICAQKTKEQMLLTALRSHNISETFLKIPDYLKSPEQKQIRTISSIPDTRMSLPNTRENNFPEGNHQILSQCEFSQGEGDLEKIHENMTQFQEEIEEDNYLDMSQLQEKEERTKAKIKKRKPFMLTSQNDSDPEEDQEKNNDSQYDKIKVYEDQQVNNNKNEDSQDDYRNQYYLKNNKNEVCLNPDQIQNNNSKNQKQSVQAKSKNTSYKQQQIFQPSTKAFQKQLEQQAGYNHLTLGQKLQLSPLNNNQHMEYNISEQKNYLQSLSEKSITDSESDVLSIPINDHAYGSQAQKLMSNEFMKEKLKINLGSLQSKEFQPPSLAGGQIQIGQNDNIGYHDEFMNRYNEFSQSWRDAINAERRYNDPLYPPKQ